MLSMMTPAVTAAEASTYLEAVGAIGWPATEPEQLQAIMRGQRYVAARYNGRWLTGFENEDAPADVRFAVIEAAAVEARTPGSLNPTSTPATDKVLVGAGKLQWERVKGSGGADAYVPRIAAVDGLLAPLVRSGSTHFLTRA